MEKNNDFVPRFIEICGTDEPAKIKQLFNISYQAAKNYLRGRLPQTAMLIQIAETTNCSIDWLLTGRGEKFAEGRRNIGAAVSTRQFEESVRKICVEVINEMDGSPKAAQSKIVRLQSSELMSEKEAAVEAETLSGGQP